MSAQPSGVVDLAAGHDESHVAGIYTPAMVARGELELDPGRPWCRRDGDGWLLAIRVQPNASVSAIAGEYGAELKVRLAAPPVDGRANAALITFLARALGVSPSSVGVVRGQSGRSKTIRVVP